MKENDMRACLDYIDANINKDMTPKSLAAEMGYSYHHFCDLFESINGITVGEYLRKVRLGRAVREILRGKPIVRISEESGFETLSGFNKAFKREYSMSPSEYRKQNPMDLAPKIVKMGALRAVCYGIPPYKGREWNPFETPRYWLFANTGLFNPEIYEELAKAQKGEIGMWSDPDEVSGSRIYFFGPVVEDFDFVPKGMKPVELPAATYAVFTTVPVHITKDKVGFRRTLKNVKKAIFLEWFDDGNAYEIDQEKTSFEYYASRKSLPEQGATVDIYIPIRRKCP